MARPPFAGKIRGAGLTVAKNSPAGNEWLHSTDCQLFSTEKSMSYQGVERHVSMMFPFCQATKNSNTRQSDRSNRMKWNEWLHPTDCQLFSIEKPISYQGVGRHVSIMFPFCQATKNRIQSRVTDRIE